MSDNLSIGTLVWISVRPLISRLWLSAAFGFAITKADIFPREASRGAGQIVLNVTLPCLMFSKIIPSFTSQNIDALGVLVSVGFLYQAIGLFLAWTTKWFFWVPHRFRYGILCAGTISNYADIPTAVIMSVTSNRPFNSTDQDLAIAYVSGFVLVFFISLFPFGAYRLVAMDYDGPDVEDEDLRVSMIVKTRQNLQAVSRLFHKLRIFKRAPATSTDVDEVERQKEAEISNEDITAAGLSPNMLADYAEKAESRVTFNPDESTAAPTETGGSKDPSPQGSRTPSIKQDKPTRPPFSKRVLFIVRTAMRNLLLPCSITIVASIIIAVVTPLKGLFTPVANSGIPNAPDGLPPLSFILDCAQFVGAASVPLGLICLGSAVARLRLPKRGEWGTLPVGAITWFATTKMLLLPVLGVLITEGLVNTGFIDRDDKVLRFVCMFFSCVPTATSQVYLTQVYSGTGEAGPLPLFLVPQYVLMFVSMTILIAYSLSILF